MKSPINRAFPPHTGSALFIDRPLPSRVRWAVQLLLHVLQARKAGLSFDYEFAQNRRARPLRYYGLRDGLLGMPAEWGLGAADISPDI